MSKQPRLRRLPFGMIVGFAAGLVACQHEVAVTASAAAPPPAATAAPPADYTCLGDPGLLTDTLLHFAPTPTYCLDASPSSSTRHSAVGLATCDGRSNQRWTFSPATWRATTFVGDNGLCLEVRDGSAQLSACTGRDDQKLTLDESGRLRDLPSGKCLTATKDAGDAPVVIAACDPGNRDQVWGLADH